ncbi:pyridoxamine 5'-phosphate oxidase family protein [Saccharopolyspora rhizosphaerae]|uniref:pyridoxamine 5'-phosphate oxidase family protein n=1 Tax=Saccharopolyspora rhizosphaerae TaxID=2492662 RepID=UPI001F3FA4D5|nr:pyridoxamine 5'-phosphate oxidase family protein [Saccharopolyspora rhizosphaerae]
MTSQLSPTERSTVRRGAHRARTDRADLHATLDAGLVCHLALVVDGAPRVLPTGYGRRDDTLYLHGSTGARSLREADEVCVSVTLVDGVVYSRAMMHHSMNYRSAVIHGRVRRVEDPDERWEALRAITEHLAPGSWDYARHPNRKELAATTVLALDLGEASVKIRNADPGDDPEDVEANEVWAGVLPLHRTWGEPVPASDLVAELPVPEHVLRRR